MDKKLIERIVGEEIDVMEFEEAVTEPYGKQRTKRIVERCLSRIDAERGKGAVAVVEGIDGYTGFIKPLRKLNAGTKLFLSPTIPEGTALVHHSDCARLVTKWRRNTEERDDKSGYERGVDFAFCKAADELENLLAAAKGEQK